MALVNPSGNLFRIENGTNTDGVLLSRLFSVWSIGIESLNLTSIAYALVEIVWLESLRIFGEENTIRNCGILILVRPWIFLVWSLR